MLQADGPAPYAPLSAITGIIDRHRQVRLPNIDAAMLTRTGVSDSLIPRTLQSLRLLGLVDEDGHPSDVLDAVQRAGGDDWKMVLAQHLRGTYEPVYAVVDPTSASPEQIDDAFRGFAPQGQRQRMVSLFIGLLEYTGLIDEVRRKKRNRQPSTGARPRSVAPTRELRSSASEVEPQVMDRAPQASPAARGDQYSITLASGGEVSVDIHVNLFTLSMEDREFVIDLVDRLTGYKTSTSAEKSFPDSADDVEEDGRTV